MPALFFLAFLPQFVDPARNLLAGRLRRSSRGAARLRRWLSGGIFIALGVTAATAHRVS
jgi:threonine/homoserine/homoserine lactone efflux protein